jgi:hypothetical protein
MQPESRPQDCIANFYWISILPSQREILNVEGCSLFLMFFGTMIACPYACCTSHVLGVYLSLNRYILGQRATRYCSASIMGHIYPLKELLAKADAL